VAVGQDANQETVALAWGVAPVEIFDHWSWFIDNLDTALGGLNRPSTVIMSDRQKGLNLAILRLLPQATEAYCAKHIERDVTGECGINVGGAFWAAVRAPSKASFDEKMEELRLKSDRCVILVIRCG